MSFRVPEGDRTYCLPHPDRVLYDPPPGFYTKEAMVAIGFERELALLTEAVRRQRAFREQKIYLTTLGQ